MIFVILGTQDKKFPRLLEAIQKKIDEGKISKKEEIIVQAGSTKFESKDMKILDYMSVRKFEECIEKADVVICHAGVGTILTALKKGKKIIAAARLKQYGEHVNDHQLQILDNFTKEGYILALEDFDKIDILLKQVKNFTPAKFKSNKKFFLRQLEKEINIWGTRRTMKRNRLMQKKKTKPIYRVVKRIIDIIGAITGCIILIPVAISIYIAKKINKEEGTLFYKQLRYGKNGKQFKLYKFRTMCIGADKILEEYLSQDKEIRKEFEIKQKIEHDPRVTKLGKFLRSTSLDELPQMINILKGEMSIVGPRPIVEREIEKYGENKAKLLTVKPGLTGYWQVNGRSSTTYEERMNMELYYVDNCSMLLDIKIFIKTIPTVLKKEGAIWYRV